MQQIVDFISISSLIIIIISLTGINHLTLPPQSEIGFGKLETYIKLDKLGEVSRAPSDAGEVVLFNVNSVRLILMPRAAFREPTPPCLKAAVS